MRPKLILMVGILIGLLAGVALTQSKGTARRYFNPPNRPSTVPISDGVLVGNTLYLSGRLGTDPKTGRIPDDVEQEIRFILDGMKATLAQADMTMDNIVSVQVFCPDLSLYDKFNAVYRTYFNQNFPARAFLGSGPLLRGARFEVQAIAVK